MRVDHLLILTFPKRGDVETMAGGIALYGKYRMRAKYQPKTISVIETTTLNNAKTVTKAVQNDFKKPAQTKGGQEELMFRVTAGDPLVNDKVSDEVADSDNVGIYILCHGNGRRPSIYEAQTTSNNALVDGWMQESANRITHMLELLGVRQLRKLSILMCGTSDVNGGGEPLFVTTLARTIKNTLKCPDFLAVGYDDYVTVVNSPAGLGTKQVGPHHETAKGSTANDQHKRAYWVTAGHTSRLDAGWSNPDLPVWSDKARG